MRTGNALFYAVSETALYDLLLDRLQREFPLLSIAGIGNPLKCGKAVLAMADALELLPSSRLFLGWTFLNDYTEKHVAPALRTRDIVLVDEFGFHVCAWAMEGRHCADTFEFHHGLVATRFTKQGVRPPTYPLNEEKLSAAQRALKPSYFADQKQRSLDLTNCTSLEEEFAVVLEDIREQLQKAA